MRSPESGFLVRNLCIQQFAITLHHPPGDQHSIYIGNARLHNHGSDRIHQDTGS